MGVWTTDVCYTGRWLVRTLQKGFHTFHSPTSPLAAYCITGTFERNPLLLLCFNVTRETSTFKAQSYRQRQPHTPHVILLPIRLCIFCRFGCSTVVKPTPINTFVYNSVQPDDTENSACTDNPHTHNAFADCTLSTYGPIYLLFAQHPCTDRETEKAAPAAWRARCHHHRTRSHSHHDRI